jgi:hypothetical protein
LATGGTLDLDDAGRSRARKFADSVRQLIVDPIYAAIEAHRAAYAAYDRAAEASDDENEVAFRELDRGVSAPDAGGGLDLGRPDRSSALRGSATSGGWRARAAD